ncbi:hypothetical protein B9J09_04340 [Xylella fastidiosa subsp. pauca]|uniref:hypothetical protein n=1 Tax=Xylella fastidiosa TaxID=2371 RepID=UPI00069A9F65|nr:hypothetical protein [Xylella fastidiosa]ARO68372.1 hypothetical protein B9J09_04340 [Xylella fastidiosa subsp. pauca]AVI22525.1 hypothetical protein BC375_04125 [Xylella fastidiosa]KXB10546.1 hypothetical protein ADT33_11010 [Xylella fastidiosa]KXB13172.1 hypothetical protein ADT32_01290 [Xylella fastidiosa]KXB17067.1 hypothetical protein ADT31_05505 [Xylella fastidiosa]
MSCLSRVIAVRVTVAASCVWVENKKPVPPAAAVERCRAAAISRDEAAYRMTWHGVYDWLLGKLQAVSELHAA